MRLFPFLIAILAIAGCKVSTKEYLSEDSELEALTGSRFNPNIMKYSNVYLYSVAAEITAKGPTDKNCWYYKEVPQDGKHFELYDALSSSVRLNTHAVSNKELNWEYDKSIVLQNTNATVTMIGAPIDCSEAVVGAAIMTTMPVLSGVMAGATSFKVVQCAMSVYGLIDSTRAIHRNWVAKNVTGYASLDRKMMTVDGDGIWRIQKAVSDTKSKWDKSLPCAKSNQIMKHIPRFKGKA